VDFKETTMLKLCGFPISNYYNKVKIALLEKGIPFEEDYCTPSQGPEFVARSPMGKVPFLELGNGQTLTESQVLLEYLEDAYPDKPLYPRDPLARARIRELIAHMELHLELPARRLYRAAFFGGVLSDETRQLTKADMDKGVRAFMKLAKFSPWVAGAEFTAADCAAAVHLPLISLATKTTYGADAMGEHADAVKAYLKMANERPSIKKINGDRKAYLDARQKK
jgi:glutathione S-transferase